MLSSFDQKHLFGLTSNNKLEINISRFFATFLAGLFLPETKSEDLQDTVHDAKRRRLAFEKSALKGSVKLVESECSDKNGEREPLAKI